MYHNEDLKPILRRYLAMIIISILCVLAFFGLGIVLMYQYSFGYALYSFILCIIWTFLLAWWISKRKELKKFDIPLEILPPNVTIKAISPEELHKMLFGFEFPKDLPEEIKDHEEIQPIKENGKEKDKNTKDTKNDRKN